MVSGPVDPRVGQHPYFGPTGDTIRACDLPGCGRQNINPIHDSAPAGSRVLEAAKAVARLAGEHRIIGSPPGGFGERALSLLDQALAQAGHPTRSPSPSERAMAEAARLKREQPDLYAAIVASHRTEAEAKATLPPAYGADMRPGETYEAAVARQRAEPATTPDGTSEVLADVQHRGQ